MSAGPVFLVMELLSRGPIMTLDDHGCAVSTSVPLDEQRVCQCARDVLLGLHCLHNHEGGGAVHRDIKPDNLLVTDDLRVKIGDFGLARFTRYVGEPIRMDVGTPMFHAPEAIGGTAVLRW